MLNEMSGEQRQVFENIKNGYNVIVDACAGSGKSTTILSIAKELPEIEFLQMTYNAMLRYEIKEKTNLLDIENLKVHTFHSLAVKHYMPGAHTDTGIREILYNNTPPRYKIPKMDVLVLDEAQDMTYLYYQFMVKFCRDMYPPTKTSVKNGSKTEIINRVVQPKAIQLLVLGDFMQGLYEFKGADIRFLTLADKIWETFDLLKTHEFKKCTLKMSYRITRPMAEFVNNVMLGTERLEACKDGEPVMYIRNSRSNLEKVVIYQIFRLLEDPDVKPSDIFVLGASVKGPTSNIRKMENVLAERNVPCHVPMLETDKIDERVIDGKVVFSTFHSVKGRQRKYVFIIGFDHTYMTYYARNLPRDKCPNTLYVGATRATQGLFLLESDQYNTDRPLEFLKMSHHEMIQQPYISFKGIPRTIFYEKEREPDSKDANIIQKTIVTPTDLIKFVPESVIEEIMPLLDKIFVKESGEPDEIELPTIVKTRRGFHEDVSDLNGIAIPCIYHEHILKKIGKKLDQNLDQQLDKKIDHNQAQNILRSMIQMNLEETKQGDYQYLKKIVEELPETCSCTSDYLYLANVYVAVQERLYFKLKQIERDEYEWLTPDMIKKCLNRFDKTIGQELSENLPQMEKQVIHHSLEFEHRQIDAILYQYFDTKQRFRFSARVDLVTDKCVWELKCTSNISNDHKLQVVIYAWLWRLTREPGESAESNLDFKILNIKTGEMLRVEATIDELTQIMVALLKGKYGEPVVKTDEEFIADCFYQLML